MDTTEAGNVLRAKLAEYRKLSYEELTAKIGEIECFEIVGPSGTEYQIEVQFFWDDKTNSTIRVGGGIDDGGLRAFMPLCDDFLMDPDGRFVGES